MRDLHYFQSTTPPFWAFKKHPRISGWCSQCGFCTNIAGGKKLTDNASVLVPFPAGTSGTVIWGQEIIVPDDKSYLIVDGNRIDLVNQPRHDSQVVVNTGSSTKPPSACGFFNTKSTKAPETEEPRYQAIWLNEAASKLHRDFSDAVLQSKDGKVNISMLGEGKHPEGLSIYNLKPCKNANNDEKPLITGIVRFASGVTTSVEYYLTLSEEERFQHDNIPKKRM